MPGCSGRRLLRQSEPGLRAYSYRHLVLDKTISNFDDGRSAGS